MAAMIGTLLLRLPDVPVPDGGINVGSFGDSDLGRVWV
jgi:hypothetical protein